MTEEFSEWLDEHGLLGVWRGAGDSGQEALERLHSKGLAEREMLRIATEAVEDIHAKIMAEEG